jgi:hypothetical protein
MNLFEYMENNNLKFMSPFFQDQDNKDVIVGLEKTWKQFNSDNNLNIDINFNNVKCPYTNMMVVDINYFLNHEITMKFLKYIDSVHGIYSNRWGDLPIWGLILSSYIEKEKYNNNRQIKYLHDVHEINI